jgi:hypothetical protein
MNTLPPFNEGQLLLHIKNFCRGKHFAASAPELAALFKSNTRTIRARVRNLRLLGYPVCGTPESGFYWPMSREEGQHTRRNLLSQEEAVREAREGFERGLEMEFGDAQLFGGEGTVG